MQAPADLKSLTSLRFFAAAWVVLYHYWANLAVSYTPSIVATGHLGVELFFILSGFILSHVYLPSFEAGQFRYGDFLWSRLARIYPLHLATMVGVGVMAGLALAVGLKLDHNVVSLVGLPVNLLLLQGWGLTPVIGWNYPSWSISAEWFAYLCFPAFALLSASVRRWPIAAVIGAVAFFAATSLVFQRITGSPLDTATIAGGAVRIVPCFALGCALYLAWRSRVADRRKALAGAAFFGVAVLATALFGAPDILIVFACAGLIISLAQVSGSGGRLLTHPILVYLGEISYAIYMVSIPWSLLFTNVAARVLHLPGKQLPWPLWIIFAVSLLPVAAAAHHLVEQPARDRMKLWWNARPPHKLATAPAR
jgi:peptidoglycan/LPS O-acetylase OafA/YrhL